MGEVRVENQHVIYGGGISTNTMPILPDCEKCSLRSAFKFWDNEPAPDAGKGEA
jgi:hypothetical protein